MSISNTPCEQLFDLRIDLSGLPDDAISLTASPFWILNNIAINYSKYLDGGLGKTESKRKQNQELSSIISRYYGLRSRSYTKEEISILLDKSKERIRRGLKSFKHFLRNLINDVDLNFKINEHDRYIIRNSNKTLEDLKVISLINFRVVFLPKLNTPTDCQSSLLTLYFDTFNIEQRSPNSHLLRNNNFLFVNPDVQIDQFFDICYAVYNCIEKYIIPIDKEDITIDVRRKISNADPELIEVACNQLNEIEAVAIDTSKYQIRLDCLSTATDMVYRILNEKKKFTKLAEIRKEINHQLHLLKSTRKVSSSVATTLAADNKFASQGKTGFWGLTEWNGNNETMYDLITNAIVHFNRPLKKKEIYDHIAKSRPLVPHRSLDTIIYEKSKFTKLNDDTFIVSEWRDLYKDKISSLKRKVTYQKENPIKDQIKDQAIQLIQKNGGANLYLINVVNTLNKKFEYPKASVYKVISENSDFIKGYGENNKMIVSLAKQEVVGGIDTSVFVSYSWESESHQSKVISFVDFLRKKGFNADLDISMMQNETSVDFNKLMHAGISKYDKVIIILSETYKNKAESFEGGVGKEYRYILANLEKEKKKFILTSFLPLTKESIDLITPLGFIGKEIVDLTKDENNQFQHLFAKLTDSKQYNFSEVASGTPLVQKKQIKPFTLTS